MALVYLQYSVNFNSVINITLMVNKINKFVTFSSIFPSSLAFLKMSARVWSGEKSFMIRSPLSSWRQMLTTELLFPAAFWPSSAGTISRCPFRGRLDRWMDKDRSSVRPWCWRTCRFGSKFFFLQTSSRTSDSDAWRDVVTVTRWPFGQRTVILSMIFLLLLLQWLAIFVFVLNFLFLLIRQSVCCVFEMWGCRIVTRKWTADLGVTSSEFACSTFVLKMKVFKKNHFLPFWGSFQRISEVKEL